MSTAMSGIEQAIRAAGSQAKLAEMLGCTQQNVSAWLRRGYATPKQAVAIEQVTGISRATLVDPRLAAMFTGGI
jgi:DNA-binding transcriptional regulator YdaS (Cro superfamily)